MRILDSHAHLWDDRIAAADWLAGESTRMLRRAFDAADLSGAAADGTRFIVVTAESSARETERLLALDAPAVAAVVGWVDPLAAVAPEVARLRALGPLAGVRLPAVAHGDGWLADSGVVAGVRALAAEGLVIELLAGPEQLGAVALLCRAVPEGAFVLDHFVAPASLGLAALPNLVAKLSGAALTADPRGLAEFGPDRVLFGSDWPVSALARSYVESVDLALGIVEELGWHPGAVLSGTAARVYGVAA